MKKIKYSIIFVLITSVLSAGFAFTPHRIEPVDTRADGMGGSFFNDSESVFTLFSNPAGLAFAGDRAMWSILPIEVGGPLPELWDLGMGAMKGNLDFSDTDTMTDMLNGLIGDSGLNLNMRLGGPLTFGGIKNNFGWGLVNTIYVSAEIPSLSKSDINANFDLGLVFGYAVPIDLGFLGKLSIGFSGRGIAQVQGSYTEGITELFGDLFNDGSSNDGSSGGDFPLDLIPLYTTFGFGFDMGVRYRVLNIIDVSVVWKDVYTATWTQTHNVESFNFGGSAEYNQITSQLGVGVGLDIPLEKITGNIISHLGVYLDYNDLWPLFNEKNEPIFRNPILELSMGAELVLFDVLAFRVGISEMYPAAGFGIYMGNFRIDFSIYGRELGLEPGYAPQLNMGLSLTIQG